MSFPILNPSYSQISHGHGGWVQMEPLLVIADWHTGVDVSRDLTSELISLSVTHDVSRTAGQWILEATVTIDGWAMLRPFVDWLIPTLRVRYADGAVKSQHLGHFLVLDSPEHREEIGGTVRIDGRDALWVLNSQGLSDILIAPTGTVVTGSPVDFGPTVRTIIAGALVPGAPAGSSLRAGIGPIPSEVGLDGPIYDIGTPRLEAINGLLKWGANSFDLEVSEIGILSHRPYAALYRKAPQRRWLANPPDGLFQLGSQWVNPTAAERVSPIVEAIESTPLTTDLVNEIVIVGGIASQVVGTASVGSTFVSGGDLPTAIAHSRRTLISPYATSQAKADAIAAKTLEKILTENTSLTLMLEPDPEFLGTHGTVELGIWDGLGRPIANGVYAVNNVRYGFMPEDPLMRVEVSALDQFIPAPGVP